ncbi:diguanylate cyclase [Massilia oculi]|jgi:diguanylate cyclase (GGDEF)-like protein|uniref:diguanylate cyclase n=1 Tax=Massilia oculi TaxID=945844 RepID=A0A2S2DNT2_9BURK|nr:GGDEF domain-containing protein [Massilia oculi]AWL06977.1 GGDEF domain-containing protein [Massilia oculi]
MTHITERDPDLEVRQLRALLTMSRELMQADQPFAALALAGGAMVELTHIDRALLLVRGEVNECIAFDHAGTPAKAASGHDQYRMALARLDSGADETAVMDPRTMLVGVPTRHAMAVLAAGWTGDAAPETWDARRRLLSTIMELVIATLGRIAARTSLEVLVSVQHEQMVGAALAHADELARRDESEGAARALALTDVLTGLNNRRGFFVRAEHMFKLARRKQAGCAVIYADIDGLKLVNDQLGHATGDQLIQDAASVLRESLRDSDVLARFGGDEFVAFALDDAHPRVILARLQDNLRAFNLMQERSYLLAVSAGAVQCDPGSGAALLDYVQSADREMYLHKRSCLH